MFSNSIFLGDCFEVVSFETEIVWHITLKTIINIKFVVKNISPQYKHQLTHRQIIATFLRQAVNKKIEFPQKNSLILIKLDSIANYPVSRLVDKYLKEQKII